MPGAFQARGPRGNTTKASELTAGGCWGRWSALRGTYATATAGHPYPPGYVSQRPTRALIRPRARTPAAPPPAPLRRTSLTRPHRTHRPALLPCAAQLPPPQPPDPSPGHFYLFGVVHFLCWGHLPPVALATGRSLICTPAVVGGGMGVGSPVSSGRGMCQPVAPSLVALWGWDRGQ